MDFALGVLAELFGAQKADAVQLAAEYDPQPPRALGRLELARPMLVARVRARTSTRQEQRLRVSTAAPERLRGGGPTRAKSGDR
ncbi:hypothetical protein [Streptomyces sp. NPDC052036]|uniref:hypothetical protein n=1 Tax=Streptomyces sp. NPDC052036 TaxID=3155171 RepID=UPI00342BE03A